MRAMAVGAVVGAAAIFAAAPADARGEHAFSGPVSTSGGVSVSWHGSASRGCADAGLCGYRGSSSNRLRAEGDLYIVGGRGLRDSVFGSLYSQETFVVRVARQEPGGDSDACVDVARTEDLDLDARVQLGRVRIRLAGPELSTGRCAGPDLAQVLSRATSANVSLARLRRGNVTVDLTARAPFRSGHFSGKVVSTLRLHVGRLKRERILDEEERAPGAGRRRLVRAVDYHAVYRVTASVGKLSASFHGLEAPLCGAVDACGVSGVASWAILSRGGTVVVDASALARRSDHGLRGLFAAVRRRGARGYVSAGAELRHEVGTISARVDRAGGTSCHDSKSALPPLLFTPTQGTGARIALGEPGIFPGGTDLLRTGCPGPTQIGVVGRRSVAVGKLPLRSVAKRKIALRLRGAGRFDDGSYAGTWRSGFTLRLRRVKQRLSYHYVRVDR